MMRLGVFLLPPGRGGMLVHRRVTSSIKFAGSQLYTWVERDAVRVKCLTQGLNKRRRPRLVPEPLDPETSTLTLRLRVWNVSANH